MPVGHLFRMDKEPLLVSFAIIQRKGMKELTIEEIIKKAESCQPFQVPASLMPAYIRYLYTTHRAVHEFLGIRVEHVQKGEITLAMPVREDYTNSGGFLYGGILSAMADAMSLGLIVSVGKSAVTTNLSINFVKSHPIEGAIRLYGHIRHNGRRMMTLAGEIRGQKGELLADIQITMMVVAPLPEVPATW